jgi:hypothetical protein
MNRFSFVITVAALLFGTSTTQAQDRIEPAAEIRVVEVADNGYGQRARIVVEDLTRAEILRIQLELSRAGYDLDFHPGQLDDSTRRALTSFQAERGLEICGCVTYETIVALGIIPEVVARVEKQEGGASSTVIVDRAPVVIYAPGYAGYAYPGYSYPYRRRGYLGPSIVVGHEPAIGAGQLFRERFRGHHRFDHRRFPSRPDRGRDIRPLPTSPHPGSRIQPGDRLRSPSTGGSARPARPMPQRP